MNQKPRTIAFGSSGPAGWALCVVLLFGCSSEQTRSPAQTSVADPAATPLELLELGAHFESLDSLVEALRSYDSCVARAGRLGSSDPVLARGLLSRARLHLLLDLYSRSEIDADSVLKLEQVEGFAQVERGQAWLFLAGSFEGQKKFPEADSASDSALTLLSALPSPDTSLHVDALCLRGRILVMLNFAREAERLFSTAVELCPGEANSERRWEAQSLLGWSLVRQARLEEAEPELLRAFAGLSGKYGNEDPLVRAAAGRVAELYERWKKPDLFAHYQALATHYTNTEDTEQ